MGQVIEVDFRARAKATGASETGFEVSAAPEVVELSEEDAYKAPFNRIFSGIHKMVLDYNGKKVVPLKHFLYYLKEIASFFPDDTLTVSEVVSLHGIDFSNAEKGVNIWAMMNYGLKEEGRSLSDDSDMTKRRLVRLLRETYACCRDDLLGLDIDYYPAYVDGQMAMGNANSVVMSTVMEETFVDYAEFLQGFSDFLAEPEILTPVHIAMALKSVINERVKMCLNGVDEETSA